MGFDNHSHIFAHETAIFPKKNAENRGLVRPAEVGGEDLEPLRRALQSQALESHGRGSAATFWLRRGLVGGKVDGTIWVWVNMKPGIGPQVLVNVSIHQGSVLGTYV